MMSCLFAQRLCSALYLAALLFPVFSYSQVSRQWVQFYDGLSYSGGRKLPVVTDSDGNVYVTGAVNPTANTAIFNTSDYATIKYNSLGTVQWAVRYDAFSGQDEPMAIAIDKSGSVYVTGTSTGDETGYDFATIKYNSEGIQQWVARFNSSGSSLDYAADIKVDKQSNVYVTGSSAINNFHWDYTTVKYNSSGVQQWVQYYNGTASDDDMAIGLALDPVTCDVYVTGWATNLNTGQDLTTVKYSSAGIKQWARDYNSTGNTNDVATDIALDAQGDLYVTGINRVPYVFNRSVVIKYNRSGSLQWTTPINGQGNSDLESYAIAVDKASNIYITGLAVQPGFNCITVKFDKAGKEQWRRLYHREGMNFNQGEAISLDNAGNIYVAGISGPTRYENINFFAIKYGADANEKWVTVSDNLPSSDAQISIAVDKFNDVFLSGFVIKYTGNSAYHFEFGTIKYIQPEPLIVTATDDTTIYYGYGSNCVPLKANATGGVPPYTFTWLPGGSAPNNSSTIVCPTASTVYKVIVKDAVGTTGTAQVTVNVIDVRCGDKVIVCHNGEELCIASQAVDSHLKHGDKLGSCSLNADDCDKLKDIYGWKGRFPFIFKAYPNPFSHESTLIYQLPLDAQVTIALVDLNGREIKTLVREKKAAGYYSVVADIKNLVPGTYVCRMVISASSCQSVHTLKLFVIR